MKVKIRSRMDFYAGGIFIFFGIFALVVARDYEMGTTMRMGPGYFPSLLGGILVVIGLIISFQSLWVNGEPIKPWNFRPLLILGAVVVFAFMLEPLGLAAAIFALTIISSLGGVEFDFREVIVLYLVLLAMDIGLFIYGLGLPFKVWPI